MRKKIKLTHDPLENARLCDALYICPKDSQGKRLGPLVAYAGTYTIGSDPTRTHFVGDVYFNFAMVEPHTDALCFFADELWREMWKRKGKKEVAFDCDKSLVLCGSPIGGYKLADALGVRHGLTTITAEKKVTVAGSSTQKEEAIPTFSRHTPQPGDEVMIVEDVCNNFKNTAPLVAEILQCGAKVTGILCALNRSMDFDTHWEHSGEFTLPNGTKVNFGPIRIPIISVIRLPFAEYKQHDPAVADDVARNNICWNPKRYDTEWKRLMKAMEANT